MIFIIIAAVIGVLILLGLLYFMVSPMPVVRLLRRGQDEEQILPEKYQKAMEQVQIIENLTYPSQYQQNTMDLYLPKKEGRHPVILWVHGGAFVAGDKCGIKNWGTLLASQGYAVAAMNYVWAPEGKYPAQLYQMRDAFVTLDKQSEEYQLDMNRVAIAGDSAGAYYGIQFALAHGNAHLAQELQLESPLSQGALKCMLLYCGPYDLMEMMEHKKGILALFISRIGWSLVGKKDVRKGRYYHTMNPMNYISSSCVPCYITDGNHVSFDRQGKALAASLREKGVNVQEHFFDIAKGQVNHEYQMNLEEEAAQMCLTESLAFLEQFL